MIQLALPEQPQIRNDLEEKYRVWLHDHARVFALFEKFALEMLERKRRFGIGMLAERVRWEVKTSWVEDEEGFKINNSYRAYLMRDLLEKHPAMIAFVETRKVRGEEAA